MFVCKARYESDLKEVNSQATSFPYVRRFRGVGMLLISFQDSITCKVKLLKLIEIQAAAYHIFERPDGILKWMYLINQSNLKK